MSNEFEGFDTVPTLTFGEPEGAGKTPAALPAKEAEPLSDSVLAQEAALSEEERKMVEEFSSKIDLRNSAAIMQYGVGAQKKLADFSEKALENVRTKDMGEVGDMIAGLVAQLQDFDAEEEEKGLFGFFKKQVNKEVSVDKICGSLEQHQVQLMKDMAMLDKMYELNLTYYKELSMYILAGKKRLEEVRREDLAQAAAKAQASGLAEDAQAARDLDSLCNRFEKKIHDLELTRTIAMQTAPQIRLVQDSDTMMVEKIQSTLVNTIPLWKNQMVIALGVEHSNQAAKAQREVTNLTNELLQKNAERLKTATTETARESERGVVDIETLKNTNAALLSTLDEVVKIQAEGRQKRRSAEQEMARMEQDLKNKLLEISGR